MLLVTSKDVMVTKGLGPEITKLPKATWPTSNHHEEATIAYSDANQSCSQLVIVKDNSNTKKRKRYTSHSPRRRVSFSDAKSVVEVQGPSDEEKQSAWYGMEDYSEFMFSAHRDAQALKEAFHKAQSPESLFHFLKSNPHLCPRGLEKVLTETDNDDECGSSDGTNTTATQAAVEKSHPRRMKRQKAIHRQVILSLHRFQKETGEQDLEEIRKFSEDSSKWAVEKALKLGHIDAAGLI